MKQEPVYRDPSLEFFSNVKFKEPMVDPIFARALAFHLGGEYRECSLVEIAWRIGLYTEDETIAQNFPLFLLDYVRYFNTGTQDCEL